MPYISFRIALCSIGIALITVPFLVQAHGTGLTLSEIKDGYVVDVDYSEFSIEANIRGAFTFRLFSDESRTVLVDFSDLWVRIMETGEERNTLFAGTIAKPDFGSTGFLFAFPREGTYQLEIRYNRGDETLLTASFPLIVAKDPYAPLLTFNFDFWVGVAVGVALVSVLLWGVYRWRRPRSLVAS